MPWAKYNEPYYKQKHPFKSHIKDACVRIIGGTAAQCNNTPIEIPAIPTGAIVKVPVVLSEFSLQLHVNAIIDLPEPAVEIKKIKKHVKVTQCLLLQDSNILFIKGYVRKHIEYMTHTPRNPEGACGELRQCTIKIPFDCTTAILFNGMTPLAATPDTSTEYTFHHQEEMRIQASSTLCNLPAPKHAAFHQISAEFFNDIPYCELVSAKIIEFDEYLNPVPIISVRSPHPGKQFGSIEEKMVIHLAFKLLQNRQIAVPPTTIDPGCPNCDKC